jgi:DNA topoisomerase IB
MMCRLSVSYISAAWVGGLPSLISTNRAYCCQKQNQSVKPFSDRLRACGVVWRQPYIVWAVFNAIGHKRQAAGKERTVTRKRPFLP